MRFLVLGGDGMLGHRVLLRLREGYPGTACTVRGALGDSPLARTGLLDPGAAHASFEASRSEDVARRLRLWRPEWVVNCVGVVKQREAASDAETAISVNALFPHVLARVVSEWGGRLIHFSTDCVFTGRTGGYTEDSATDAEDLYGRTKALGEVRAENALTLRTSMIGRELKGFRSLLEWFLSQRGRRVRGFANVIYSGVTTPFLARIVEAIVTSPPRLAGLYQVTAPPISKYDLLVLLREAFALDVEIDRDEEERSDRSLVGSRFYGATRLRQPDWGELVAELANDPTPYESWRSA